MNYSQIIINNDDDCLQSTIYNTPIDSIYAYIGCSIKCKNRIELFHSRHKEINLKLIYLIYFF